MDDFAIRFAAVYEYDQEQDQTAGCPDDLVTLLPFAPDETVSLAASNETPCARWFFLAFAGSHVNRVTI